VFERVDPLDRVTVVEPLAQGLHDSVWVRTFPHAIGSHPPKVDPWVDQCSNARVVFRRYSPSELFSQSVTHSRIMPQPGPRN
jgi:hypothetical protein